MKISSVLNIQVDTEYDADIVIDRIEREGDANTKKPIVLNCRFEQTGSVFHLTTWSYSSLDAFKNAAEKHLICRVSFVPKLFRDTVSFNLVALKNTGKLSSLEIKNFSSNYYENEINNWISSITNQNYKTLLQYLLTPDFYERPAAYSIHHAFPGGLALHSYSVARIALSIAETYNYENINRDILLTGALLHDIGKTKEYLQSGRFSLEGNLMSHIVLGVEIINDACDKLNIDKNSDEMMVIKHIIVAHHGKLEFGSPVTPKTIEAFIISQADNCDSKVEAIQESLESPDYYGDGFTTPIKALEGGKIMIPNKNNKTM